MTDSRFSHLTAAAAVALGIVLALTGCATQAPQATPTVSTTVTTTATVTATPVPPAIPSTANDGPCATPTLAAAVAPAPDPGAAGSEYYVVTLTNIGSTSCTLDGYPGVEFVGGGNGTTVGAQAQHDHDAREVPFTISLDPHESAGALLTIRPAACNGNAVTVDGFRIFPPNESKALFAADATADGCGDSSAVMSVGGFHSTGEGY